MAGWLAAALAMTGCGGDKRPPRQARPRARRRLPSAVEIAAPDPGATVRGRAALTGTIAAPGDGCRATPTRCRSFASTGAARRARVRSSPTPGRTGQWTARLRLVVPPRTRHWTVTADYAVSAGRRDRCDADVRRPRASRRRARPRAPQEEARDRAPAARPPPSRRPARQRPPRPAPAPTPAPVVGRRRHARPGGRQPRGRRAKPASRGAAGLEGAGARARRAAAGGRDERPLGRSTWPPRNTASGARHEPLHQ